MAGDDVLICRMLSGVFLEWRGAEEEDMARKFGGGFEGYRLRDWVAGRGRESIGSKLGNDGSML
jgi:hypothetical protein